MLGLIYIEITRRPLVMLILNSFASWSIASIFPRGIQLSSSWIGNQRGNNGLITDDGAIKTIIVQLVHMYILFPIQEDKIITNVYLEFINVIMFLSIGWT